MARAVITESNQAQLAHGGYIASAVFTPAAAAYSANDVMDVAKAFQWVDRNGLVFPGGELKITSTSLQIATTALQASEAAYSLALFNVTPPSALADNAAYDIAAGDRAAYQGLLALGTPVDLGSTLEVDVDGLTKQISVGASGITYGTLITVAGFTATAVARLVKLHAIRA